MSKAEKPLSLFEWIKRKGLTAPFPVGTADAYQKYREDADALLAQREEKL